MGDRVTVVLRRDDAPRVVDVPPALAAALGADAVASAAFERLSFTHRKEYARWIAEAKRDETKAARVTKTLAMLRAAVKHP